MLLTSQKVCWHPSSMSPLPNSAMMDPRHRRSRVSSARYVLDEIRTFLFTKSCVEKGITRIGHYSEMLFPFLLLRHRLRLILDYRKRKRRKKRWSHGFTWFEIAVILSVFKDAAGFALLPYFKSAAATSLNIIQITQVGVWCLLS